MLLTTNSCIKYAQEKHYCPHCHKRLTCCHAPPIHVGDGLGWGSEVLFICLNDNCPLFVRGWKQIELQYGHSASYRYMKIPDGEGQAMMVAGKDAFKGCEVDPEALKAKDRRYAREKEAVEQLETCVAEKNLEPVLYLLTDEAANLADRERACELLIELNDIACIDALRNHKFINSHIEQQVTMAIRTILKANFKKECPHCAEIIKSLAKVCKHCGRDV